MTPEGHSTAGPAALHSHPRPVLVVLEGSNDIEFLRRLATRLSSTVAVAAQFTTNLASNRICLVPCGGGNPATWPNRFAALGFAEYHVYDREVQPEIDARVKAVAAVIARPGCRAVLTTRRSLENYLHPAAIAAAGGGDLEFDAETSVAGKLAMAWHESEPRKLSWDCLPHRKRARLEYHAKRWLNADAVEQMTEELLAEQDPAGEIIGWFQDIVEMAERNRAV